MLTSQFSGSTSRHTREHICEIGRMRRSVCIPWLPRLHQFLLWLVMAHGCVAWLSCAAESSELACWACVLNGYFAHDAVLSVLPACRWAGARLETATLSSKTRRKCSVGDIAPAFPGPIAYQDQAQQVPCGKKILRPTTEKRRAWANSASSLLGVELCQSVSRV